MAGADACPECGAKNGAEARRCRICGRLLNASIPEVDPRDWELPESVRKQMERDLGLSTSSMAPQQTHLPGEPPPADLSRLPPPPAGAAAPPPPDPRLRNLPPPPGAPAPDPAFSSLPPPPAAAVSPVSPAPPVAPAPSSWASAAPGDGTDVVPTPNVPPPNVPTPNAPPPFADGDAAEGPLGDAPIVEVPFDPSLLTEDDEGIDAIVIEARPRHEAIPVFAPEEVEDEVFDPDALFRDLGQPPPPPPPPRDPDEIVLPPREIGPDPLWSIAEGRGELSNEEIDRLMREALREERLKRRPGFLDKVIRTGSGGDDDPPLPPPPLPPPPPPR